MTNDAPHLLLRQAREGTARSRCSLRIDDDQLDAERVAAAALRVSRLSDVTGLIGFADTATA